MYACKTKGGRVAIKKKQIAALALFLFATIVVPVAANSAVTNAAAYLTGVAGDLWNSGNKLGGTLLGAYAGLGFWASGNLLDIAIAATICWWQVGVALAGFL